MALPLPDPNIDASDRVRMTMLGNNSLTTSNLKNKMMELENRYYGPKSEADIAQTQAQTNKLNTMTPLEAAYQQLVNKNYVKDLESQIESRKSLANYRENGGYRGLGTAGTREQQFYESLVAKDNPDLPPEKIYEASNALANGLTTLQDGTPINISPASRASLDRIMKGSSTSALITQGVKANQADAELRVLNEYANRGLKPYSDTVMGYSPQQVLDTFKTDNESQKKLGKFIASQALQYEAAQNRIRLAQGQPGVTSTEELMKLSGQLINTKYPKLSGIARREATRFMDEALEKGLQARNAIGISPSLINKKSSHSSSRETGRILVKSPNGKLGSIPSSQWKEAEKAGYKRA